MNVGAFYQLRTQLALGVGGQASYAFCLLITGKREGGGPGRITFLT